jgi:hypothetical protein
VIGKSKEVDELSKGEHIQREELKNNSENVECGPGRKLKPREQGLARVGGWCQYCDDFLIESTTSTFFCGTGNLNSQPIF